MDEPPPPYSEAAISQNHTPQRNPVTQLRRYLVEIIAFTFNADFARLIHALGQDTTPSSASLSTTNSILTEAERAKLLRLAHLTRDLHRKQGGHQWLTTRDSDRRAVADGVVIPALRLELCAGYILKLISTYADHEGDGTKRQHTLISLNTPYPICLFRHLTLFLLSFCDHLHSHVRIISATAPNEHVRILLANAMKDFLEEELGITKIPQWCGDTWPNKWGSWYHLWQALISDKEEIQIYADVLVMKIRLAEARIRAGSSRESDE